PILSNGPATPDLYTLSLHDALPIYPGPDQDAQHDTYLEDMDPPDVDWLGIDDTQTVQFQNPGPDLDMQDDGSLPEEFTDDEPDRSEEHTSELQSPCNLVCRLLLEKK